MFDYVNRQKNYKADRRSAAELSLNRSRGAPRSARRANRRSHSRTVVYGTPSSAATWFHGRPRAAASSAAQITSTP
ncbi:MAG TPA: hypothetical protein VK162_12330, partial [Streptosporangiaceae bacterium]|nr:hypothetical protein [Streptosporangiaceae bacterium]